MPWLRIRDSTTNKATTMSELFELSTSPISAEEVAVEPPVVPVEAPPVEAPPVVEAPPSPPPPPSTESDTDSGTESDTEDEGDSESDTDIDPRGRLFIGPSDTGLHLRRQVAAGESPAIRVFSGGYMTDSELELDEYRVPDEGMLIEHTLSAEGLWAATVPIPVWVMVTVFIVFAAYLCLLIGTGILAVRGPR